MGVLDRTRSAPTDGLPAGDGEPVAVATKVGDHRRASGATWVDRTLARSTPFALAVTQLVLFAIIGAVAAALLYWNFNTLLTRQIVDTLRAEADGIVELDRTAGSAAVRDTIAARSNSRGPSLYVLIGPDDRKIAGNLNRWPPEIPVTGGGGVFRYEGGLPSTAPTRLATGVSVMISDASRLLVARDVEEHRSFAETVRWVLLGGLATMAAIALALGFLASRHVLRRIDGISAEADAILSTDLSRRIAPSGGGDEIDELARRLNALLDRIELLMVGMREISDNIAHDLKTPLNRLRNRAEAALRDPTGAAAHRQGLERTIEAADEIIATFNALLLIARLEAGARDETMEVFALERLITDVGDLYAPVAEDEGLELVVGPLAALRVRANRQLVSQAVANLVDNAIKYGQPSSGLAEPRIEVSLRRDRDCAVIRVCDRGPGIPAEARERVLRRFVRLDASRSKPGTGLGLSLVAAVSRLHGGSLTLDDNGPGLIVELSLPIDGPPRFPDAPTPRH